MQAEQDILRMPYRAVAAHRAASKFHPTLLSLPFSCAISLVTYVQQELCVRARVSCVRTQGNTTIQKLRVRETAKFDAMVYSVISNLQNACYICRTLRITFSRRRVVIRVGYYKTNSLVEQNSSAVSMGILNISCSACYCLASVNITNFDSPILTEVKKQQKKQK